jgi:hypothetical protein
MNGKEVFGKVRLNERTMTKRFNRFHFKKRAVSNEITEKFERRATAMGTTKRQVASRVEETKGRAEQDKGGLTLDDDASEAPQSCVSQRVLRLKQKRKYQKAFEGQMGEGPKCVNRVRIRATKHGESEGEAASDFRCECRESGSGLSGYVDRQRVV